ncbi:unnamed protein product [Prunus armeniaca]
MPLSQGSSRSKWHIQNSLTLFELMDRWRPVSLRSSPAPHPNWVKGCQGEPEMAPAQEMQPSFVVGPTSPRKSKGKSCLG